MWPQEWEGGICSLKFLSLQKIESFLLKLSETNKSDWTCFSTCHINFLWDLCLSIWTAAMVIFNWWQFRANHRKLITSCTNDWDAFTKDLYSLHWDMFCISCGYLWKSFKPFGLKATRFVFGKLPRVNISFSFLSNRQSMLWYCCRGLKDVK